MYIYNTYLNHNTRSYRQFHCFVVG